MVFLHALGQCLIRTGVTTITPRAEMCFALASYLTRERGKRVPRRLLEALFWPRMRAADASHSLSELIHKLRQKGVLIERDDAACIWLPRDAASIDVESLNAETLATIAGRDLSILPGYAPRASAAFNDWVDDWRGHMQLRLLDQLVAAILRASAALDWPFTLALADQALGIDAQNEPALLARARAAEQLARHNRTVDTSIEQRRSSQRAPVHLREGPAAASWSGRRSMSAVSDDTTLVGRDQQMERLRVQARCALQEEVCCAYVSAPAGVGKSRLIRELSGWMRDNGAVVCTVSCARHDGHRPLSAFVQAVPRLQALPGAAGCAPSTLACLALITQLTSDAPQTDGRDDSLHLSSSIRAAVVDLVDAIADEQPLLLLVEDVHWIDKASWSLLRTVAATVQRSVFLVCTSRVRWQHAVWGEPDSFLIEELPTLDALAARAHMTNYLTKLQRGSDERFIDWCVETSGGNPYFIEELVNFWITTGEQYAAPPSLIALVEARLACLRPDALRVIQAAAILGKNSTLELLQQVLEFPTHVLFSSIEELGDAGLLTAPPAGEKASAAPVLCRHDLITRAATRGLSAQGRALLHHAAARAIESVASGSHSAELLWDCADHWQAAGQSDRSIKAVAACARHLHDMGLVDDAVKCCESALAVCQSDANRVTVLRTMAQSQYAARDWRSFCETVTQVRALESASAVPAPIHDDLELCELSAQRSLHRDWNSALERTLQCVRSLSADASHRVQAAINALKLATNVGALQTMDVVYREATELAHSADVGVADRLTLSMIYHTIRGDSNVGAQAARELLLVAECTLPLRHRLTVMRSCASALRRGGLPDEAEDVCEALFRAAVPLHCFDLAAEACSQLIEMYVDSGRIENAAECVTKYRQLHRPKAELLSQPSLRIAIARLHIWRHQWDPASQLLGSPPARPLWEDRVTMLRSAALATKLRLDVGCGVHRDHVTVWIDQLAPLIETLRTVGAQDYECYSLYLGYRYVGETTTANQLLTGYAMQERRDVRTLAPEICDELARLEATPVMQDEALEPPECAEATDAMST